MFRDLIEQLTRQLTGPHRKRHRQARRANFHRRLSRGLRLESLEDRNLLAALTINQSDGTSVTEGGGLTFTVTLDDAVQGGFTVDVTLADMTATGSAAPLVYPKDYDNVVAQLNFNGAAGETRQFTVATLDDAVVEATETFTVSLSASNTLVNDSHTATGTIVDNDRATLSVGNATVVEGDGGTTTLSFPVTLSAAVDVDVFVDYTTQDGTAIAADGDYVAVTTPASVTIKAGETSGTIDITVNGDTMVESDETLSLLLSNLQTSSRDVTLALTDWVQLGQDIDGEAVSDQFGWSVAVSNDGNTVVIGARLNGDNGDNSGHARAYKFDGAHWTQLGQDIVGEAEHDQSGWSVSLSDDGSTVLIGALGNDSNGGGAGQARVYRFDGTNWIQLGEDIDGEAAGDTSGSSVSLSGDGDTVVIGAPYNDGNDGDSGHARVYSFDGTHWAQLGQDIDGEAAGDQSGSSVSLSGDGNTLVIGAPRNGGNGPSSGYARAYRFEGTKWIQLGQDIDGESEGDLSGRSVSLSGDGNTMVIGAPGNNGNGGDSGQARVYRFNGTTWTQLGQDIDGEGERDQSGFSVSLSGDGNTLAIGAPSNDDNGRSAGQARFYHFDGTTWTQLGDDIEGGAPDNEFGLSVAMSGDGSTMVVGAPANSRALISAGQARVFQLQARAAGTITNDDRAVTVEDMVAVEGKTMTFTVTLNNAVQGPFTVDVTLADVTATGGAAPLIFPEDYNNVVARLNFTGRADETQQFTVATLNDRVVEGRETFTVSLSASNTLIDDSDTATGTITNNDRATLSVGNATVLEGNGGTTMLSFPLTLSKAVDVNVSLDYTTQHGTASAADGDYVAVTTSATFTINAGDTSGTINITVNGDTTIESNETLSLLLSNLQADGRDMTLEWSQIGQDIDGEAPGDFSGRSVSLSGDGKTLVIGAPSNDIGNSSDSGHARVYRFDDANWSQIGQDIDGEASQDQSGWSVSLSGNGNTVVIGARENDGNGDTSGHARVYRFDGANWTQLGQDIDGEASGDVSGWSVSLSRDGNTAVIGAPDNNGNGSDSGHARVYRFDSVNWTQLGQDIDGEAAGDLSGYSVSLSGDGSIIAIGAPENDGNGDRSGQARVYHFDGANWTQLGQNIDGEAAGDKSGWSVSLSGDGNTLAIGAPFNDGNGANSGHTRAYRFDGTNWLQLGQDIDGEGGLSGSSVSLSDDGNILAIGEPVNASGGQVRIYQFDGDNWTQISQDIGGEAAVNSSGHAVSLSGDGNIVVIGAPINNGNGFSSGHARVYRLGATGTIIDNDSLLVEFNQPTGMDAESSGGKLPQLLVTGTIHAGHNVTIDVGVVGGTAVGGGVDYTDPTTVTIPAGTYNATAVAIPGLSVTDDTLLESDETIELKLQTGSQIQVGDDNGDGIAQDSTRYTIQDDELPNIRTLVELNNASILTIRDVVPGGKDDQLELTIAGDRLVITDRNNLIGNFADNTTGTVVEIPLAAILGVEIDLLEGDDQLSIDFSNAPPDLNLSLTINGGGGRDTVTFTGATVLDAGELRTNGKVEDIFVNAPITMARGTIALDAAQSLEVNADISLGTGTFQLTTGRDVFGNCSLIHAGTADVHVVAGTGIAGVRFETAGHVALHGGSGGIVGCPGEIAVTAKTLTLMTDTSVGTALRIAGQLTAKAPLLTSVNAVQGTVGGLGIFLLNDRPLSHNVELVAAAPLGIKDICPGSDCLSTAGEGSPFQNTVNRFDVNNDRSVSPLDVLAVVNHLNSVGAGVQSEGPNGNQARSFLDVNGDRAVSALDALMIINHLNARIATLAEGEWTATGDKLVSDYHAELLLHRDWSLASAVQEHLTLQDVRNDIPTRWHPGEGTDRTGIVNDAAHLAVRRDRSRLPGDDASEEWESLLDAIAGHRRRRHSTSSGPDT